MRLFLFALVLANVLARVLSDETYPPTYSPTDPPTYSPTDPPTNSPASGSMPSAYSPTSTCQTYTIRQGCWSGGSCSGTVEISGAVVKGCLLYSASDTDSARQNFETCTFWACPGYDITASACDCSGDTYLRLVDASGTEISSNDDSCGTCSSISLTLPGSDSQSTGCNPNPCPGSTPICEPGLFNGHSCYTCSSDSECIEKVPGSIACSLDDGSCVFPAPSAYPTLEPTAGPTTVTTPSPTKVFMTTATAGYFTMTYYQSSDCNSANVQMSESYPTAKCFLWTDNVYTSVQSVQAIWSDNILVKVMYSDLSCNDEVRDNVALDLSSYDQPLDTCHYGVKFEFLAGTTLPKPKADTLAYAYYSQDSSCSASPYMLKYYYLAYAGLPSSGYGSCAPSTDETSRFVSCDSTTGIATVKSYSNTLVCDNTPYEYPFGKSCYPTDELYNAPSSGAYFMYFCATSGATVGSLQVLSAEPTAVPSPMPTLRPSKNPSARPTANPTPAPTVFTIAGAETTGGWVAVRQCSKTTLTEMTAYSIGSCVGLSNYDGGFTWGFANSMSYQLFKDSSGGIKDAIGGTIQAVFFLSKDCSAGNKRYSNSTVITYTTAENMDSCSVSLASYKIVSSLVSLESDLKKYPSQDYLGKGVAWYSPTDIYCQNPALVTYDVFYCQRKPDKITGKITSEERVCATPSLFVKTFYEGASCEITASKAVATELSDDCVLGQSDDYPYLGSSRSYCGNELKQYSPTQAPTSKPSKSPTPAPFSSVPTLAPVLRSPPVFPPTQSPTAASYTVSIVFKLPGLAYDKDVKNVVVKDGLSKVLKAIAVYALTQSGVNTTNVKVSELVFSTNPKMIAARGFERKLSAAADALLAKHNYLEVTLTITGSYAEMTAAAANRDVAATPAAALQAALQQNLESSFEKYALQEAAKQGMLSDKGTIDRLYKVYTVVSNKNFITTTLAVSQNQPTPAPVAAAPRPTLPPSKIYRTVTADNNLKDDAIAGIIVGGFVFVVGAVGLLTFLYVRKEAEVLKEASENNKAAPHVKIGDILPSQEAVATSVLKFFPQNNSVDVADLNSRGLALPVTLLYISAFLACLIYFSAVTTSSLAGNQFLSLSGTSSEQICSTVPNTITAKYDGDIYGAWETNPSFSSNVSVFTLDLKGTSIDEDQYRTVMASFDTKLYDMGLRVAARDVAFGLLTWTTFGLQDKSSRMNFYSNMAANYILDGMSSWGVAWSREGQCNPNGATGSSSLENTGKYLRLTYSNVSSGSNPCPAAFDPIADFQHDGRGTRNLNIDFDTRSILTALAVNLAIIDISHLNMVKREVDTSADFGFYYIDPFYDKMTPIFCLKKENQKYPELSSGQGNEVCFVIYKNLVLYPGMWSVQNRREGENNIMEEFVDLCTCPEADSSVECQSVFMQISLLYWRSSASSALNAYKFGLKMKRTFLDSDPVNGDLSLNKFFFSSLPNQMYSQSSINGSTLPSFVDPSRDPQVLFDNICPDMGCAAFQFFLSMAFKDFFSVNAASVQYGILSETKYYHAADDDGNAGFASLLAEDPKVFIPKLSCENLFYKADAIKSFVKTPPTRLVQLFSACHMTQRAAFISAIGSSAGSANLYSQIIFAIVVAIILGVVNNSAHADNDKILSPGEKADRKKEEEERQMLLICEMVDELVKAEFDKDNDMAQTKIVSNKFHELYRKKRREAQEAAAEREKQSRMSLSAKASAGPPASQSAGDEEEGEHDDVYNGWESSEGDSSDDSDDELSVSEVVDSNGRTHAVDLATNEVYNEDGEVIGKWLPKSKRVVGLLGVNALKSPIVAVAAPKPQYDNDSEDGQIAAAPLGLVDGLVDLFQSSLGVCNTKNVSSLKPGDIEFGEINASTPVGGPRVQAPPPKNKVQKKAASSNGTFT